MKRHFLISGILMCLSLIVQGQNFEDCEIGYCSKCHKKFTRKAFFMTFGHRSSEGTETIAGMAQFEPTGIYDQSCNQQAKQEEKQNQNKQAAFNSTKEKIKNGETVVEWYDNGKAKFSMANPNDKHTNITRYRSNGTIEYKFKDNIMYVYTAEGKFHWKGPGIMEKDAWGNVNFYQHGVWKNGENIYLYDHNNDASRDFKTRLNNAKTQDELDAIFEKYPFQELKDPISVKREELKKEKAKADSLHAVESERTTIVSALKFMADSYYLQDSDKFEQFLQLLNKKLSDNAPTKIIIVGHVNKVTGQVDEEQAKAFYILSLNRATFVANKLKEFIKNHNVTIEHYGVSNYNVDGYNDSNGNVEILFNQDKEDRRQVYNLLKSKYGISSSDDIIPNVELLKLKLWNIYMKVYGKSEQEILTNIPYDLYSNPHVMEAIRSLPEYMVKIDNGTLKISVYKQTIKDKLAAINSTNYDIVESSESDKKKGKKK